MRKGFGKDPAKGEQVVKSRRVKIAADTAVGVYDKRKERLAKFEGTIATLDEMDEKAKEVLGRIANFRKLMTVVEHELAWFREKEPDILDALGAKMLSQFMGDEEKKWTTTDYGIMFDKRRLSRNLSTVNMASLFAVVQKADEEEVKRFSRPKKGGFGDGKSNGGGEKGVQGEGGGGGESGE